MTIQLANDVEELLRERLNDDSTLNLNDLANDLLRSICESQGEALPANAELEQWLLQAADEPTSPLVPADFERMREKLKSRAASSKK